MRTSILSVGLVGASLLTVDLARAANEGAIPNGEPRPNEYRNAVQLDLGLGVVGLAYERIFERHFAVQAEAHIFGTWFGPVLSDDLPNLRGFGGQIRPSFFLTHDAPRGVYVAPFLRVDRVTGEKNGQSGAAVGYSAGAFLGYSFVFGERFNLRIGGGAQFMNYGVRAAGQRVSFKSFFPALDLVLGFAF